jgi:ChrR-like protein with cupin domain
VSKPEFEFFPAPNVEWTPVPGGVAGLHERILAHDPVRKVATRMLRFAPGADTTPNGTLTHDFWEEVYILEGAIYDTRLGQNFTAGMYACRPPGMKHGPWTSKEGCITFEVRYYSHEQALR